VRKYRIDEGDSFAGLQAADQGRLERVSVRRRSQVIGIERVRAAPQSPINRGIIAGLVLVLDGDIEGVIHFTGDFTRTNAGRGDNQRSDLRGA